MSAPYSGNGRPAAVETTSPCILVTGAAGFIGSHLCERLLDEGYCVWGLDNFDDFYDPAAKRENLSSAVEHAGMHLVEGDVRDPVLLDGLMTDVDFDAVVHLAARPGAEESIEEPMRTLDVNVGGTLSLLEAMRRHGLTVLLYGSSTSVYGAGRAGRTAPYEETAAADRPLSTFAATKRAAEMLCHTYHHLHGMTVYCLRLSSVFGPRQRPDLPIHQFARGVGGEEEAEPHAPPSFSQRDPVFVDDAVDGIALALARATDNRHGAPEYELINLGGRDSVDPMELARKLAEVLDVSLPAEHRLESPGPTPSPSASIEKGGDLLGYRPRVSLDEGLAKFSRWFHKSRQHTEDAGLTPPMQEEAG